MGRKYYLYIYLCANTILKHLRSTVLCQFHRCGKWALERISNFYTRSQSEVSNGDTLCLIPKPHSFPHHPGSPWALIMGSMPQENRLLHSQRLWLFAVKAQLPSHVRAHSLALKQTNCLHDTGLGWQSLQCLFVCFCLFLSLRLLMSQLWSNPRTACAQLTLTYREGVWSPEGHWVKVSKETDRWPLASLQEGAVCWAKGSGHPLQVPNRSESPTPLSDHRCFLTHCQVPNGVGRICLMEL